jgi:hypothetical protein
LSLGRVPGSSEELDEALERISKEDSGVDDLIFGSDDYDSSFDFITSPHGSIQGNEDTTLDQRLPPRRPVIDDEETGEETKIPLMTHEEFNESFDEHVGRGAQAQWSAEVVAAVSESTTGEALMMAGVGEDLKMTLEAEDSNLEEIYSNHTENTEHRNPSDPTEMKQRNDDAQQERGTFKEGDSLDSDEWTTDDDGSVKSLTKITLEEKEQRDRRLQDLEKRSKHHSVSTKGSSKMDLTSLINKQKWKQVMRKIGSDPKSMSVKHDIELNGSRTRALPLHHAVSQTPPVSPWCVCCDGEAVEPLHVL